MPGQDSNATESQALLGSHASARQNLTARRFGRPTGPGKDTDRGRSECGSGHSGTPCGASLPNGLSLWESGRPGATSPDTLTVGMVDQAGQRTPRQKRSAESSQGQIPMQTITNRPADDTAGEEVDDDGQIQPSFAGPDIGDVCSPLLVRPLGREVLIDDVRRDRQA